MKTLSLKVMGNPLCPHPLFRLAHLEAHLDEDALNYRYRRFRLSLISHAPNLKILDDRYVTAEERASVSGSRPQVSASTSYPFMPSGTRKNSSYHTKIEKTLLGKTLGGEQIYHKSRLVKNIEYFKEVM